MSQTQQNNCTMNQKGANNETDQHDNDLLLQRLIHGGKKTPSNIKNDEMIAFADEEFIVCDLSHHHNNQEDADGGDNDGVDEMVPFLEVAGFGKEYEHEEEEEEDFVRPNKRKLQKQTVDPTVIITSKLKTPGCEAFRECCQDESRKADEIDVVALQSKVHKWLQNRYPTKDVPPPRFCMPAKNDKNKTIAGRLATSAEIVDAAVQVRRARPTFVYQDDALRTFLSTTEEQVGAWVDQDAPRRQAVAQTLRSYLRTTLEATQSVAEMKVQKCPSEIQKRILDMQVHARNQGVRNNVEAMWKNLQDYHVLLEIDTLSNSANATGMNIVNIASMGDGYAPDTTRSTANVDIAVTMEHGNGNSEDDLEEKQDDDEISSHSTASDVSLPDEGNVVRCTHVHDNATHTVGIRGDQGDTTADSNNHQDTVDTVASAMRGLGIQNKKVAPSKPGVHRDPSVPTSGARFVKKEKDNSLHKEDLHSAILSVAASPDPVELVEQAAPNHGASVPSVATADSEGKSTSESSSVVVASYQRGFDSPPSSGSVPLEAYVVVEAEHLPQFMGRHVADRDVAAMIDELLLKTKSLSNLPACVDLFESSLFQECLRLLRKTQAESISRQNEQDPSVAREEWAKIWATALSRDADWAWALNRCRKACFNLLYMACDLSWDDKEAHFGADLLNIFKLRRVTEIMRHCLVMDLMNAQYNLVNANTEQRGLGWYSTKDLEAYQALSDPPPPLSPFATINKRLKRLQEGVYSDKDDWDWVHKWMEIRAPPREEP